jgi:hypothetical protein
MGQAERQPSPANKQKDIVTKFAEAYEHALADAKVSSTHTATEGWRKLYGDHVRSQQSRRRELAKQMRSMADEVEVQRTTEELEKEIGELKKSATMIREADESFEFQTIFPVRQPVSDCERVITEHLAAARREENASPLHNTGLELVMREAVSRVAKARWDAESGQVLIAAGEATAP